MLSAALAAFLSLCLFFAGGAQAWLATSYYEQSTTVYTQRDYYSTYLTTYTDQIAVKPTVTSFEPVSMETSIDSYDDITIVNVLVPSGIATTIDKYGDSDDSSYYTSYYVDVSMTAPTRCPSSAAWVWKTSMSVSVPVGVTPSPTSTTTSETQAIAFGATTTYTKAFLNPTDVPSSYMSSKSFSLMYYMAFASSCTVPSSYATGIVSLGGRAFDPTATDATSALASATASPSSDSDNTFAAECQAMLNRGADNSYSSYYDGRSSNPDYRYDYDGLGLGYYQWCDTNERCACFHGIRWWALIPIIICSWVGFFLIAGLIESWFRFRNLARGRSARRGLPISWSLIMIPWSCFFLCCLKRGYTKKSAEEQKILTAQWKEMGFWKKIGRWLKWGFRYKYPEFLGPAPFRRTKWEEKDIAAEAQRRLSYGGAPMATTAAPMPIGGLPVTQQPVVGQTVNSYYAPQVPAAAYAAPGVAPRDFAQGDANRGIGRNRDVEGQSPKLPPRPMEEVVNPVSPIDPSQEAVAGPAPKSPKGKGKEVAREDLRGDAAVGTDAPQEPPIAVAK